MKNGNTSEHVNLQQKAMRGVAWSAAENWGAQTISFILFLVLARLLEPNTFGLIALANIFVAFVNVLVRGGLGVTIIQRHTLDPEHLNTAFWTNLGTGALLTVVGITSAGLIANLLGHPQLIPIIRCLSFDFLIGPFIIVQQALLQRKLQFKALTSRSLVSRVISGIVAVSMAFGGFGVWSLVGQQLTYSLVNALVLWGVSDWRPGFSASKEHLKELLAFGSNMIGINLFAFCSQHMDNLLIGYFLGPTALGFYTVAYRSLQIMTQLLIITTNKVALPIFSELQKEPERLRRAFYAVTRSTSLIAFPVFLGMALLAHEIVFSVFGEQWMPAAQVVQVLACIGLIRPVHSFNGTVLVAMGKPSWRLGVAFLNAVANVAAFALAVRWGIVAVAAALTIRGYLLFPLSLWLVDKLIHIDVVTYLRQYAVPLAASLMMATVILAIKHFLVGLLGLHTLLVLSIFIGALVYGLTILATAPIVFWKTLELVYLVIPVPSWRKA